jgi:WD40 repeat protein
MPLFCKPGIASLMVVLGLGPTAGAQTKSPPAAPPSPSGVPTAKGQPQTKPPATTPGKPQAALAQPKPGTPPPPLTGKAPDSAASVIVKPNRPLGEITALAYSPDGKRLAVGTARQVVLYDTTTWQVVGTFLQVQDSVRSLAFHPNGQLLAIGSGQAGLTGATVVWDTTNAVKPNVLPNQYDTIEAVAFDPDGKELLIGSNDKKVRCFTSLITDDGPILDAHNDRVQAVAFSPKSGFIFLTGGLDRIVKVWDQQKVVNVINFDQSEGGITGLAFLPNGSQFVGSSLDGKLYWWGVNHDERKNAWSGYHYRTNMAHPGGIYTLGRSANGQRIVTGGADKTVIVWNADNGGKIREFKDSPQPAYAAALNPDGKIAVAGGREGVVYVWDVEANKLLSGFAPPALPSPPKPAVKASGKPSPQKH